MYGSLQIIIAAYTWFLLPLLDICFSLVVGHLHFHLVISEDALIDGVFIITLGERELKHRIKELIRYRRGGIKKLSGIYHLIFASATIVFLVLKGYLPLKIVISEHIVSEVQFKNFLFHGKVMVRSRDIQCFVSLTISLTPKFVTS